MYVLPANGRQSSTGKIYMRKTLTSLCFVWEVSIGRFHHDTAGSGCSSLAVHIRSCLMELLQNVVTRPASTSAVAYLEAAHRPLSYAMSAVRWTLPRA